FEGFFRITGNRPETPEFFAGVGVVGGYGAPHAVIGAVVAHEHQAFGYVRRVGNAGLRRLADKSVPDLLAGGGVDSDEATVAGAHEDLAVPDGDTCVRARRV